MRLRESPQRIAVQNADSRSDLSGYRVMRLRMDLLNIVNMRNRNGKRSAQFHNVQLRYEVGSVVRHHHLFR